MNVIFLDYDGVLDTVHKSDDIDIENRIKILSNICNLYDAKIVISASLKTSIDEETLAPLNVKVKKLFELFNKYNIRVIGRTKEIEKKYKHAIISTWKEDEIIDYLNQHPEIEHFCIIDDDEGYTINSDLNKVRNHLVMPIGFSNNPDEEGLLEKHIIEVGNILKLDNEYKISNAR